MARERLDIATDADTVAALGEDALRAFYPDMEFPPGGFITALLTAMGEIAAFARDGASERDDEIFEQMGTTIDLVAKLEPTSASAASTWVMVNTAGYTIEAGEQLTLRSATGERVGFATVDDIVIPAGSTTATGVQIVALEAGAGGTGLSADPQLEDARAFVQSITVPSPTTGGADGETTEEYLDRLREERRLASPRAILPGDFEVLARRVPGVDRALALDNYIPAAANEQQTVSVASATGGTFTLTFSGQTTGAIAHNATAATVQTALAALSNVGSGNVSVTGGPLSTATVTVDFIGALAGTNHPQMTSTSSLTGTGAAVTITTTREGIPAQTNVEGAVTVALVDTAGQPVSSTVRTAVSALLAGDTQRVLNLAIHLINPTYTAVSFTFTGVAYPDFAASDVQTRAIQAVKDFLSPANWGRPPYGDRPRWLDTPIVRGSDLIGVVEAVEGFNYLTAATLNGTAVAAGTTVTLPGPAAMPAAASIVSGTVT